MTPLVLTHGFMGGSDQWHLQAPLGQGRVLITPDLPGFGKHAHLPVIDNIEGFAEWVLQDLTRQGIECFDLMGHSMGGMIAQEMSRLAPERIRKLILYGTGPVGDLPGRFEPIATSMQRARDDGASATARRIAATWFLDLEEAEEYPGCAAIAEMASLDAILAGLKAMQKWSGRDHLAAISAETLILWGDCDRTYQWPQVETLWREIPEANLAVLPRCAHAAHSENPQVFNKIVGGFLADRR